MEIVAMAQKAGLSPTKSYYSPRKMKTLLIVTLCWEAIRTADRTLQQGIMTICMRINITCRLISKAHTPRCHDHDRRG